MPARPVRRTVLVTCPVVRVADIGIIGHIVVGFDHRVFGLEDVQFREMGFQRLVSLILDIVGKAHRTRQRARVRGVAFCVHAAHLHEPVQPCAVVLPVDAGHADAFHAGTAVQQGFPVQTRAAVNDKRLHFTVVLQREPACSQFAQIFQFQHGQRAGKPGSRQRSTLGKGHALHLRASRVKFLQLGLVREVKLGAGVAPGLGLCLVAQVHLTQLAAAAEVQPPASRAGGGALQVQLTQYGTFTQVKAVLQAVRGAGHVKHTHAARAVDTQGVVYRVGPRDLKGGHLAALHDAGTRDIGAVVRAVTEGVHLARRDLHHVGGIGGGTGHVKVDVVTREVARAVFGVQEGETVLHEVTAVRGVASLQGVDERPFLAVNLFHVRADILQVAALVVRTVAPVTRLLDVKHRQHALDRHFRAVSGGAGFQLVLQVGQDKVPKPAVAALEGVFPRLRVPRVTVDRVVVGKETVVPLGKLGVTVVIVGVPDQPVPGTQEDVLRALVNAREVVGVHVVGQQVVHVKILPDFLPELVANEGGQVVRGSVCRDT